ncbi:hypothetical protein H0H87_011888 [Tephrocybe sp. NHM501043]|nr:hypothetical protein H0H87_011888 [Tephrocybe sp. NHM501043]
MVNPHLHNNDNNKKHRRYRNRQQYFQGEQGRNAPAGIQSMAMGSPLMVDHDSLREMFPDNFGSVDASAGVSVAEGDIGDWNMEGNTTPTLTSGSADMVDLEDGGVVGLNLAPEPTKAPPLLPVDKHDLIGFGTPVPSIQEITVDKFSAVDLDVDLGSIQNDGIVLATVDRAMVIASTD